MMPLILFRRARRRARKAPAAVLLAVVVCVAAASARADNLVLLDGSTIAATVTGVRDGKVLTSDAKHPEIALQGLRRIERDTAAQINRAAAVVFLPGGGRLLAKSLGFDGQALVMEWAYGKELKLPYNLTRGVVLAPAYDDKAQLKIEPDYLARVNGEAEREDRLFILRQGKMQSVNGWMNALTDQEVAFRWNEEERKVPRGDAYGLTFSQLAGAPDLTGQGLVHLRDGSSVWGVVEQLEAGKLRLAVGAWDAKRAVTIELPWDAVLRLEVRSNRLAFASDLEPAKVSLLGLGGAPGWKKDQSLVGGPLLLGTRKFEKGLAMHAHCALSYDLAGRYDSFAAVIGMDPRAAKESGGRAVAEFVVLADDKEVFRQVMKAEDAPQAVSVKIHKAARVVLVLEMGPTPKDDEKVFADLDLGDFGNWGDARFIAEGR